MIRHTGLMLFLLAVGGCAATRTVPPAPAVPAPVPPASPVPAPAQAVLPPASYSTVSVDHLSVVQADSDLIDTEKTPAARVRLVADAQSQAEHCLAEAPQDGVCHYARGIVYGLAAREQPLQANALLKNMLGSLTKAESLAPALDHAGPARLQAIVLLRAPPWPLGPGDAEAGLAAAKRAVALDAAWPANQMILQEAQKRLAQGQ